MTYGEITDLVKLGKMSAEEAVREAYRCGFEYGKEYVMYELQKFLNAQEEK